MDDDCGTGVLDVVHVRPECGEEFIRVALVGNANVGKSVIFNKLTGLNQYVGNWPGKTVSWREGACRFEGREILLVDLPGTYSLSTYSLEEGVTKDYLVVRPPDVIVDVVDASNLERNLFLTFQLLLLDVAPVVVVLNQCDVARRKGLHVDAAVLSARLGVPVVEAVAVHGKGVHETLKVAVRVATKAPRRGPAPPTSRSSKGGREPTFPVKFGREVAERLAVLVELVPDVGLSPRFVALKLLEGDDEVRQAVGSSDHAVVEVAARLAAELETMHGHDAATLLASETYATVREMVEATTRVDHALEKSTWAEKLDHLTTHSAFGYVLLVAILLGVYSLVFVVGSWATDAVDALFSWLTDLVASTGVPDGGVGATLFSIFWEGALGSLFGAFGGVLPFVFLFYFAMEVLQDTGYLPRAAYLMDNFMHRVGLHGKSTIPLLLGFGCNVPGCTACRILETEQERRLSVFVTSLVPCSAVAAVVMGLVGVHLGIGWAFALYAVNFAVIVVVGRAAFKLSKGKGTELIIELHEFRRPNFRVVLKQTWNRGKEFVHKGLPLMFVLGAILEVTAISNLLEPVNTFLAPVTVAWLGLPVGVGVFLLYGVARKELTIVLLVTYASSLGLSLGEYLTPLQMVVFSVVTMLYVPCAATIVVIGQEVGWNFAGLVTSVEVGVALLLGGFLRWGVEAHASATFHGVLAFWAAVATATAAIYGAYRALKARVLAGRGVDRGAGIEAGRQDEEVRTRRPLPQPRGCCHG
ncbi:MAG: ferrous iron transport protein B [Promethearchaeota archaeon]